MCAVGRCPNTDGLFGENVKPDMERGRVLMNENFESSIPGVYAIGDLIFGAQLAHAASAQGMVVAEKLAGKEPFIDLSIVPGCVYTDPEIASAGMTEDQAKEKGIAVKCGKFIMSANGKSTHFAIRSASPTIFGRKQVKLPLSMPIGTKR